MRHSLDHVRVERDEWVLSGRLCRDERYTKEYFSRQDHRYPHLKSKRKQVCSARRWPDETFRIDQLSDSIVMMSKLEGLREIFAIGRTIDLLNVDQLWTEEGQSKVERDGSQRAETYVDGELPWILDQFAKNGWNHWHRFLDSLGSAGEPRLTASDGNSKRSDQLLLTFWRSRSVRIRRRDRKRERVFHSSISVHRRKGNEYPRTGNAVTHSFNDRWNSLNPLTWKWSIMRHIKPNVNFGLPLSNSSGRMLTKRI